MSWDGCCCASDSRAAPSELDNVRPKLESPFHEEPEEAGAVQDVFARGFEAPAVEPQAEAGVDEAEETSPASLEPEAAEKVQESPACAPEKLDLSPARFTARLDLEAYSRIGLRIDLEDKSFVIVSGLEDPGDAARHWNSTCGTGKEIQEGDRIMEVNGTAVNATNFEQKLAVAKTGGTSFVDLAILRPCTKIVKVRKSCGSLGITMDNLETRFGLFIKAVKDGPISDWNSQNPSAAVTPSDRIVGVNGQSGSVEELVEVLKAAEDIEMKVFSWVYEEAM